jgi:hypothetical protein
MKLSGNHPFTVTEPEGAWCVLAGAGCHAGTAASTTSGTLTEAPQ